MTPDVYFYDWENPPGDLEHGEFRMLGDNDLVGADLFLLKRAGSGSRVSWTLWLVAGPSVERARADRSWPLVRVQRDGALVIRVGNEYHILPFRIEDTVPLGINLYDRGSTDAGEVFDRALALAEDYREQY